MSTVTAQLRHIGLLVAHAAPDLAQAVDAELSDAQRRQLNAGLLDALSIRATSAHHR
ncbi:MAG: hypothetical protein ACRDRO_00590 [Pseudonocardiaceae bacterium]